MIILPDRNIPRSRILMAVPRREWMPPSYSQKKTVFGHENRTLFRITARLHDGFLMWESWFEDRDDADAFLYAAVTGSLPCERNLWRLPSTEWHPEIGPDLIYELVTQTFITATGSSTYTRPSDWNNSSNTVECLGGGGSGGSAARSTTVSTIGCGGGGGGYGKYTNLSLSGNADCFVGTGGTAVVRSTAGATVGNAGADTWFNGISYAAASVGGTGGGGGGAVSGTSSASGGAAGSGKGTSSNSGGRGGNGSTTSSVRVGTGGGGAAGKNGAGNQGVDVTNVSANTISNGGSGDAGSGGAAGVGATNASATNGGDGTEWQSSPARGSGGGGGGATANQTTINAGSGGSYGGGGGGVSGTTTGTYTSGAGIQGLIVVEYTPGALFSLANNNLPMLGM